MISPIDAGTMLRAAGTGLTLAAAALLLPQSAFAQACTGNPALSAQFALGGFLTTQDQATGYGVEARTNPAGPIALGATIGVLDFDQADDNDFTASASMAWELTDRDVSVCPVAGVEYRQFSAFPDVVDATDGSVIGVPVGLAAGKRMGTGTVQFIPSAEAGLYWQRISFDGPIDNLVSDDARTETDAYLRAGATAATNRVYGRAALERIFQDNAENVFRFSVGFIF